MTETVEMPIYISEKVPEDVSPKHLHQDFKLSSKYLVSVGQINPNTEYGYEYFAQNYPNKIITEYELHKLVEFWNLAACRPQEYIGDIPYINQLEITDFFRELKEPEMVPDPKKQVIVISTKDLVYNPMEINHEIEKLEHKMRMRQWRMQQLQEKLRPKWLVNDPIILYPIRNFEFQEGTFCNAYMVVTAWGEEAKLVEKNIN